MKKIKITCKDDFAKLIRQSPLSVQRVSKESKVAFGSVENWLYGHSVPSLENVCKVLNAIGYELIAVAKENENDV